MPRLKLAPTAVSQLRLAGGLAVGQVIGRGALALGLLMLVRELSQRDFGTLALALALVAILATLADAGFARLLVRDTARAGDEARVLVRDLLLTRLIAVAVVAAGAAGVVASGTTPFSVEVGALAVAYLVFEAIALGYENAAAGAERPWRFVLAQTIAAVGLLGGLVALVVTDAVSLGSTMAVLGGASALKVCGHLLAWRGSPSDAVRAVPRERVSVLFRQALPFLGLAVLATVYYRVGVVALYAVQGADATASYAAAFRLIDVIAIVAGVGFLAVSPVLSRMHRDHPERIWAAWRRTVMVIAAVAVPAAAVIALAAQPICRALFGAAYAVSAAGDLRLLLPGAVLMVMQGVSAAVVFMSNDHRDVLKLTAVNVTACIVGSLALSAAYGSNGAAVALSLAELLSFVTFAMLIRRRHRPSGRVADAELTTRLPPAA